MKEACKIWGELVHNRIDIEKEPVFLLVSSPDTVVSLPAEREILEDNLLATIPRLGKEWRLTFDYKPTAISPNGGTLLHLSAGCDNVQYGDRTPYIGHFDGKTTRLVISSAISGDQNKHVRLTQEPPLGSWTTLEASQRLEDGVYVFRFTIGGETAWEVHNGRPEEFYGVTVWASDPWNGVPAIGFIRRLSIATNIKIGIGGS